MVYQVKKEAIEGVTIVLSRQTVNGPNMRTCNTPITRLGRSNMSLRIEKQNVAGIGAPEGLSNTQCE
jgi:hypothetical protein